MNVEWLKKHNFQPISDKVYIHDLTLKKAPHLDAHVNLTFESTQMLRCDLHGTIRVVSDSLLLRMSPNPNAVAHAIWVYSDKTWRSPVELSYWLGDEGGMTYSGLKSACRELADAVKEWEYQIGKTTCEVLEPNKVNSHKISMIGVY